MASRQQRIAALASGLLLCLLANVAPAVAQTSACTLVPDKRNPNDKILRCGTELTVTPAPGTVYRPGPAGADGLPTSVQLDSGALLIEFNPKRRHEFQILTPQAIASVRGTKWAMDVTLHADLDAGADGRGRGRPQERDGERAGRARTGGRHRNAAGRLRQPLAQPLSARPDHREAMGPARVKELLDRFGP